MTTVGIKVTLPGDLVPDAVDSVVVIRQSFREGFGRIKVLDQVVARVNGAPVYFDADKWFAFLRLIEPRVTITADWEN